MGGFSGAKGSDSRGLIPYVGGLLRGYGRGKGYGQRNKGKKKEKERDLEKDTQQKEKDMEKDTQQRKITQRRDERCKRTRTQQQRMAGAPTRIQSKRKAQEQKQASLEHDLQEWPGRSLCKGLQAGSHEPQRGNCIGTSPARPHNSLVDGQWTST